MNSSDGMLIVNVSAIQAVAIAAVTYYFGAWLRKKVPLLEKYSVPSPVVGGMLVALVTTTFSMPRRFSASIRMSF